MALLARLRARDRELPGEGTVMARCLAAGLPVASSCSGQGACGRCALRILHGAEALSAATPKELEVLARNEAEPDARLACSCTVVDPAAGILVQAGYW